MCHKQKVKSTCGTREKEKNMSKNLTGDIPPCQAVNNAERWILPATHENEWVKNYDAIVTDTDMFFVPLWYAGPYYIRYEEIRHGNGLNGYNGYIVVKNENESTIHIIRIVDSSISWTECVNDIIKFAKEHNDNIANIIKDQ